MTTARNHVEHEIATSFGHVRTHRQSWSEPIDMIRSSSHHWLQLSLLPRTGTERSHFPAAWKPDRFEPIGEIFLIPAVQPVHFRSECRAQVCVTSAFAPDRVAEWLGDSMAWSDAWLRGSLDLDNPAIRALMLRLYREICEPGLAGDALVELLAGQVAIELGRHFLRIEERQATGGLAAWQLRLIDERLRDARDARDAPRLRELAQLVGLSVRQMARAFRSSRGRPIGAVIADARVARARRLLAADSCIKTVAHELGFGSPSSFTAAFRRSAGETPAAYRRRAAKPPIRALPPADRAR